MRLSKIKDGVVKLVVILCVSIFALSSLLGYLSYASLKFGLPPTLDYRDHEPPSSDATNFTILNSIGHDGETYEHDFHEWNRVILDKSDNILVYGLALVNESNGLNNDLFLIKMSQAGEILWSTRYGGAKQEYLGSHPVLIDSQNNIYVYGETNSSDLILKNAKFDNPNFNEHVRVSFLLKYSSDGKLNLATYLQDSILAGILDKNDKLWLVQDTGKGTDLRIYSSNFDLINSFTISNSKIEIPYYHTYYNDIEEIHGTSIRFDEYNNLILVGTVYDKALMEKNSQVTDPQDQELFLLKVDYDEIQFNSYIGVNNDIHVDSLYTDSTNNIVLALDNSNLTQSQYEPNNLVFRTHQFVKQILTYSKTGDIISNNTITMSDNYQSVLSVSTISNKDIVSFSVLHPNIHTNGVLISQGNSSIYSYDSSGTQIWNHTTQNEITWNWRSDFSYNIKFDSLGNLYTSMGFFIAPFTDDIQLVLQKFDSTGQVLGNFAIHRSELDTTDPRFNILDDNSILLVSHLQNNNSQDINVMKLSPNMIILFNQTYGGDGKDAVFDYTISPSGEVILLGLTYSSNFLLQNAFENTYINLDKQPQVPGFVMIVDTYGQIILSSYLIKDPLLLNPIQPRSRSNVFLFMAIIGFISSFSMSYMYWREKLHSISNWDSKPVLNEVSSLYYGNKSIGYLFWGISQDEDSVKNSPIEIPTQILGFKYFFHPVRLSILKLLSDHIKLSTVELRDSLDISWNVLNPHLLSLQENEYITIKSDFSDGKLRKVIQITPNAITVFNEFKILLIEFLEKPGREILLSEADEIKLKLHDKKDKLYPDG